MLHVVNKLGIKPVTSVYLNLIIVLGMAVHNWRVDSADLSRKYSSVIVQH